MDIVARPVVDPARDLHEPRLIQLYEYLEGKRGDRTFAARGDLDPIEFRFALNNVILLDVLYRPLRFRYRMVSAALAELRGYDLTGKFLDEHPDQEFAAFAIARNRDVIEQRRPLCGRYERVMDKKMRRYEALRVPLSDDGEVINMIFAAMVVLSGGS